MVRVFTSYKRDHDLTRAAKASLSGLIRELGYIADIDEDIDAGDRWSDRLYHWLLECSAAVVIISQEAHSSTWCRREWEVLAARAKVVSNFRLVPVRVSTDVEYPEVFEDFQRIDIRNGDDWLDEVRKALQGLESWQAGKSEYLALHRAWLASRFEVLPAIGQEAFSLKSIFTDLECGSLTWGDISRTTQSTRGNSSAQEVLDPFKESNGGRTPLLDSVIALVQDPQYRDAIVVQGPAGAGKSSFCLNLAHELIKRNLHPLMVRFRDMRLSMFDRVDELLTDACRIGPDEESPPVPLSKLIDEEDWRDRQNLGDAEICRTVLILDGWDEVTIGGNTGYQAQLSSWLPKIREFVLQHPGPPLRLIVTGRPSLEVRESGFLERDTRVLTIRPLSPAGFRRLTEKVIAHSEWGLENAKVEPVLSRYGSQSTLEVLNYPLLALLGLRTLANFKGTGGELLLLLSSPTALYKQLVDQTTEPSLPGTIRRGGGTLRYLLQRAASMITVLGSEQISFSELNARFADELIGDDSALERWVERETSDKPLHRLVVNFLFKGGHPNLGCEFLHKSFREYLFAESVVQALVSATQEVPWTLQNEPLPYWQDFAPNTSIHTLSRKLSRLLAPNWMTKEVRGHLFWLLEQEIEKNTSEWVRIRDMLADVYGWWAEGVHLRRQPQRIRGQIQWSDPFISELSIWVLPYEQRHIDPQRFASLDAQLGDALLQITAFVHWKLSGKPTDAKRVYQMKADENCCLFKPGGKGYFSRLVSRIDVGSTRPLGRRCSNAWLRGICLDGEDLICEVFDNAELQGASMVSSKLRGTRFVGADLRRVKMNEAIIENADFDHADLRDAEIHEDQLFRRDVVRSQGPAGEYEFGYVKQRMATWRDAKLPSIISKFEYGDLRVFGVPYAPKDVWELSPGVSVS